MRKVVSSMLLVIMIMNMTACATILKDKETKIQVNSEPQGADVYLATGRMFIGSGDTAMRVGRTPVIVTLDNRNLARLTFKKDGYEESVYSATPHISHGWVFASFLCFMVPAVVDLASHNAYSFKEKEIKVTLDPVISKHRSSEDTLTNR